MNWGSSIYEKVGVLLVGILLSLPLVTIQPVASEVNSIDKNGSYLLEKYDLSALKNLDDSSYKKTSPLSNEGITITYPVPGYYYAFNTQGAHNAILDILKRALVLDSNLEVGAQSTGLVDKVDFILTTNNFQQELENKTDDTIEQGKFSCRFYTISKFFGNYEITAVAYYQGTEVANDSVKKIIFLKLGASGNKKPVAVANFASYIWENGELAFDGSDSYDSDGEIVSYHWDFGDGSTSNEMSPTHIYETPGDYEVALTVTDNEGATGSDSGSLKVLDYDFGVWFITKYQGITDEEKVDIGIEEFLWMLHYGGGWRTYDLSMKNENDTVVTLRFGKTTISGINAIMTQLRVEVAGDTDLSKPFEVAMEFRFPYSLLEEDQPPSEDYFSARIGYSYAGNSNGKHGPHGVESFFYFGKNSLSDPGLLRMSINPYFGSYQDTFPLTYSTSFLTVNGAGVEEFKRILSVEFDPAAHLTISSVPLEGKISYAFDDETAGKTTTISFNAYGGKFSNIVHRFILDPLPSDLSFDLTVLGERSFKYQSSNSYSFTYIMDSEQNGNIVKLELNKLPTSATVSWGLNINLGAKTASGFIDLDMSSNIGEAKIYLKGSTKPFIKVSNFPSKFRVSSSIDVPNLQGDISVSKYSGGTTTVSVPVAYDKWEIAGTLKLNDGTAKLSFDLPSSGSNYVAVGLDTNNVEMFGFEVSVVDTQTNSRALYVKLGGLATDDLMIGFNNAGGQIQNFKWSGKITKLIDMYMLVNYQGLNFDITGSWTLGEQGSFNIIVNKVVDLSLNNIDVGGFILSGSLKLNPGSNVQVSWQRGDPGQLIVQTNGIQAEAEIIFGTKDSSNLYIYAHIVLNPNCYFKSTWDWGETGHFMFFTSALFQEFDLEVLYNYGSSQNEYQYGFKIHKVPSAEGEMFTRTIQWDTTHSPVRIWILGDAPIPFEWTLNVLWNYIWYPVPFNN